VQTNDPVRSEIQLTVSANVQADFKLVPNGIIFRDQRRYIELKRDLRIEGQHRDQIKIIKIESTNEHISGTLQLLEENNTTIPVISVRIKPGLPLGQFNAVLTVFTDSSKYPQVPVQIHGEIIGNIIVKPQRIDFGFFDKKTIPPLKIITFTMEKPGDRFEILGIEDFTGLLDYEIKPIQAGRQYQVSIHIARELNRKLISGNLIVRTDYPGEEEIKVSIYGGLKSQPASP
jgi:hypothetical protein